MTKAKAGSRQVETVVTFLEMTEPQYPALHPPANVRVALMRAVKPPLHFYRYLYDVIGRDFAWVDRKVMGDDELETVIHAETTDIRVLYVEGAPAGFFELNSANEDALWLQYLGLVPDFQGRGLGKFLLSEAVTAAWETGPERLRVETCTLDDPRALALYQRVGFVPYARKDKVMEIPAGL